VVVLETSPLPCQHLFLLHGLSCRSSEHEILCSCTDIFPEPTLAYYFLTVPGIFCVVDTLFTSGVAKKKPQTKRNKPTASGSSHTAAAAAEEVGLFEDPLMVVTKK
jgi:hypothetical protein